MFFRSVVLLATCCCAALARDYAVSPRGDDANVGTVERPWRTIERVNAAQLRAGDRVLLEGGQRFAGTLRLIADDSGSPERKVIVTSYGTGRATIEGGVAPALVLDGARHINIRDLRLRGAGRKTGSTGSGLMIARTAFVNIENLEVLGFQRSGIEIDGSEDVRLTRIHAHQNGFSGISSGGATSRRLYVGHSLTENNPGDPTIRANHSGNGIVLGQVQTATIEYCESRYNGWDMPWTGNGPVGIWTYQSDKVTIQYNIAHHNRSTALDGGGFDLDGGTTNALVQYNYSHSNYGAGYLICQYEGAGRFADNVVRYNISQDDGVFAHDAGIYVWVADADMKSTLIHNNTVFNTKGSAVAFGVSKGYTGPMPEMTFYNNIFVSQGPQIIGGADRGRFIGNLYWAMGERGFRVDGYKDFDEWAAATGQEKHAGRVVGLFADPMLRKDGTALLTDPKQLSQLHEYKLLPGSPAIDRGVDLRSLFNIDMGRRDYYGTPLPGGSRVDIGAYEANESTISRVPPVAVSGGQARRVQRSPAR